MIEINLRSCLTEFNGSKFVIYSTLIGFFLLLALKLDGLIIVNYFFVFIPLWFGEFLVFAGFIIGLLSFIISPPSRLDISSRNDFFAMCFCTLEHILLLMFDLLCCYKLHNKDNIDGEQLSWLLVFSPLFVQSFIAMIIAVWSIRHDKAFEVCFLHC
ncbi:transmembrane fragile-X-F protein [Ditylenchus destructor]|nr:transmembrane fragile-X-F protein [Ditylenchus destructor]